MKLATVLRSVLGNAGQSRRTTTCSLMFVPVLRRQIAGWLLFFSGVVFAPQTVFSATITDSIAAGFNLKFHWTKDDKKVEIPITYRFWLDARQFKRELNTGRKTEFDWNDQKAGIQPPVGPYDIINFEFLTFDARVTDFVQTVIDPMGRESFVKGGNIKQGSPWHFEPLDLLDQIYTVIPDLIPLEGEPGTTLYTAVNLDLYQKKNPLGFLGGAWTVGQTLSGLGLAIHNGEIAGLEGIYWATTPFDFNPDPASRGWTPQGGDAFLFDSETAPYPVGIAASHIIPPAVPEPSIYGFFGASVLALLVCRRARRHAKNSNPGRSL
jgi:hypothetical protein